MLLWMYAGLFNVPSSSAPPDRKSSSTWSYHPPGRRLYVSFNHTRLFPPGSSHRYATPASVLWTEQKVHSHRAYSVTITEEFESFELEPDGPTFHIPTVATLQLGTTVGVWVVQMMHYHDNFGGGRNWELAKNKIRHRAIVYDSSTSTILVLLTFVLIFSPAVHNGEYQEARVLRMRIAIVLSRVVGGGPSPALRECRSHPAGPSSFASPLSLAISTADCC